MAPVRTDTVGHYVMYVTGICSLLGSVWVLASDFHPLIKCWYSGLLSFLFATRLYSFYKKNYLWYLLEMCYIVNIVSIFTVQFDNFGYTMKLLYPFIHGPLAGYALLYGDAIILHNWDKTTSYAIHVLGGVFTRRLYWNGDQLYVNSLSDLTLGAFFGHLKMSFLLYLVWAIPYTFFYLLPFNGNVMTMAKYVYRKSATDKLTLEEKLKYIGYHMIFCNLTLIVGIFSIYCWQFNYFVVGCEIFSGILNGGWHYYKHK
jgi:hypothetical protein